MFGFLKRHNFKNQCRIFYQSVHALKFFEPLADAGDDVELVQFVHDLKSIMFNLHLTYAPDLVTNAQDVENLLKVNKLCRDVYSKMTTMHLATFDQRFGPASDAAAIAFWESANPFGIGQN